MRVSSRVPLTVRTQIQSMPQARLRFAEGPLARRQRLAREQRHHDLDAAGEARRQEGHFPRQRDVDEALAIQSRLTNLQAERLEEVEHRVDVAGRGADVVVREPDPLVALQDLDELVAHRVQDLELRALAPNVVVGILPPLAVRVAVVDEEDVEVPPLALVEPAGVKRAVADAGDDQIAAPLRHVGGPRASEVRESRAWKGGHLRSVAAAHGARGGVPKNGDPGCGAARGSTLATGDLAPAGVAT